jgi:hypothetical protein
VVDLDVILPRLEVDNRVIAEIGFEHEHIVCGGPGSFPAVPSIGLTTVMAGSAGGGPICPLPFKSWWKLGSSDCNALSAPDTAAMFER